MAVILSRSQCVNGVPRYLQAAMEGQHFKDKSLVMTWFKPQLQTPSLPHVELSGMKTETEDVLHVGGDILHVGGEEEEEDEAEENRHIVEAVEHVMDSHVIDSLDHSGETEDNEVSEQAELMTNRWLNGNET